MDDNDPPMLKCQTSHQVPKGPRHAHRGIPCRLKVPREFFRWVRDRGRGGERGEGKILENDFLDVGRVEGVDAESGLTVEDGGAGVVDRDTV